MPPPFLKMPVKNTDKPLIVSKTYPFHVKDKIETADYSPSSKSGPFYLKIRETLSVKSSFKRLSVKSHDKRLGAERYIDRERSHGRTGSDRGDQGEGRG